MTYFEWDEVKAVKNLRKHGVSFEEATAAFEDPFAISTKSRVVDGEQRWELTGLIRRDIPLFVVHTVTVQPNDEEEIRLISARRANKTEWRRYAKQTEH